jgi:hypothetical protein
MGVENRKLIPKIGEKLRKKSIGILVKWNEEAIDSFNSLLACWIMYL